MSDSPSNDTTPPAGEGALQDRRRFLQGTGKWSGAAIVAAVAGAWIGSAPEAEAGAWINRRGGGGGGWINRVGGGGWINGRGGWINGRVGGGSWINRW